MNDNETIIKSKEELDTREKLSIKQIRQYWSGKKVPQQWYSNKTPLTLQWFNDISKKRYSVYYSYLKVFSVRLRFKKYVYIKCINKKFE